MPIQSLLDVDMLIMVAAFIAGGMVRGFTGGAGANFLTAPVLSVLIGPREAVPIVLLMSAATTIQLLPGAARHARWREVMPIGVTAALTMPLGAWALFTIDEDLMRRVVAATAVVLALVLLSGWRYAGRRGLGVSLCAGATGGLLTGSVSLGGPPVFLYLMSGTDDAATNRAHFIVFGSTVQVVAMAVLFGAGAYSERMLWTCVVLLAPYVIAIWAGTRLFHLASEDVFRRVSLWLMVAVSLAVLVL